MAVWLLPLADLGEQAWRLLYLVPLVGIPFTRVVVRGLPESERFVAAIERPPVKAHAARLWLLAASAFLGSIFVAPASQFMNDFLRDDLNFSAARISAFTLLTNTPAFIGIVIGGRLADRRGRRLVGAVAMAGGVALTVAMYQSQGWALWALSVAGGIIGAAAVPALGVYGPELFADHRPGPGQRPDRRARRGRVGRSACWSSAPSRTGRGASPRRCRSLAIGPPCWPC